MAVGDFVPFKQGTEERIMAGPHIGLQVPRLSVLNSFEEPVRRGENGNAEVEQDTAREAGGNTTIASLPQLVYLRDLHRAAFGATTSTGPSDSGLVSKWRMKDRMKTGYVALVLCLNIGVDPPDMIKISPCARMECWIDPFSISAQKALDAIGKNLQAQYERWQPRARYKLQLDPTVEEVKKLSLHCRKSAKSERVLFHYNGHGVPRPTVNGEIWLFNKSYTQYIPLSVYELESWLGTPSIYVFDCSAAGMILNAFCERPGWGLSGLTSSAMKDCILLAACGSDEILPQQAELPADVFTSCLTTPIKIALRWFCPRSLLRDSLDPDLIDKIPGRQNDRKTPLGELNWIFTAITDTIAWNVLPRDLFQRLFRQDLLVASLFRNFLLAERIMRAANCSPKSYPRLPPTHQHPMWHAWDMASEICLSQLPALLNNSAEFRPSSFFTEQLTAFELWLDHGSERKKPPEQLPIVLQVLLSQSHRFRALVLLGKFLDMGAWAVDLALSVGIFPYVLKLLQTTATELRQILVFIWTKILALDKSCQVDLVKDGGHLYFIRFLDSPEIYVEQRAMAAFVLAVIVDDHRGGQEACVEVDLISICLKHIQSSSTMDGQSEPLLLQWLCLCLGKLWDGFFDAQQLGLQANAPFVLMQLLSKPQPEVRASATFALGTLVAVSNEMVGDNSLLDDDYEEDERHRAEQGIAKILLSVLYDGSPVVRAELAVGLLRLALGHKKHLKLMSAGSKGVEAVHNDMNNPPSPSSGVVGGSPSSYGSLHPSAEDKLPENGNNRNAAPRTSRQQADESGFYARCVSAMYALGRDPSPHVASLGLQLLRTIGVEPVVVNVAKAGGGSSPNFGPSPSHHRNSSLGAVPPVALSEMPRSFSWIGSPAGNLSVTFRTPPASPPTRQSVLAANGMRRVYSLEFSPCMRKSADTGLAGTVLVGSRHVSLLETVSVPPSNIYNWSCGHFSRPLLEASHDEEDALAQRQDRGRLALDGIQKCQTSNVTRVSDQIASCGIRSQNSVKAVLLHPFIPIVCSADENEIIRVWNYEKGALMNVYENNNAADSGVSKLCLLNELDDSLLLVASSDGSVRVWKDYTKTNEQQLVTAWQALRGHRRGNLNMDAVVDWQQLRGYLYASGEISAIMVWDLSRENLAFDIVSQSDVSVSVLSASQGLSQYVAAGYYDGSVKIFDIRSRDVVFATAAHTQKVVNIDFLPVIDSTKVVSASLLGDLKFHDIRMSTAPYSVVEAQEGSLSAMAVHRHAPLIATGSTKQYIKVYNVHAEQLNHIRYENNFLQRIGPVSALSFHPYRLHLAAGATDSMVSIYSGDEDLS